MGNKNSGKKAGDKSELLTKEEMDRLIDTVAGDLYFVTLYKVLRYSGRRIGEIYGTPRGKQLTGGIRLKDINIETGTMKTLILKNKKRRLDVTCEQCKEKVSYKNKFCPKCGSELPLFDKDRLYYETPNEIIISMRPEVKTILQTYIKANDFKASDYIFRKYSLVFLKKQIKEHIKQANITKKFSLHGFRHYFITQCVRNGMSYERIAKWTGHINPSSLNSYNQLVSKDIEKEVMEVDL